MLKNNDFEQKLKNLVDIINSKRICTICGSSVESGICVSCDTADKDIIDLIPVLESYIFVIENQNKSTNDENLNRLINILTIISDLKIKCVDNFLTKHNYLKKFNDDYNNIINKITNGIEINDDDLNLLECKIKSSNIDFDIPLIFDYCITNSILNKKNISYESFKELIRKNVLRVMSTIIGNPKCIIVDDKKSNSNGEQLYNRIYLDEEYIRKIYFNGNLNLIRIIFHELKHVVQYKEIKQGNIDMDILYQIMDKILKENNEDYYLQNYNNISYEKDAEYYGIVMCINYVQSLGFSIKNDSLTKEKENLIEKMYNNDRIVQDKLTTLEEAFNKIIFDKPLELDKYLQLKFLYKIENNKVIPKTKEEVKTYLDQLMKNNNLLDKQKQEYYEFYQNYFEKQRNL